MAGCASFQTGDSGGKLNSKDQAYRQHWETALAEKRSLDQVLSPRALAYVQGLAKEKFKFSLTKDYLESRVNFFMVPGSLLEGPGPLSERPEAGALVPAHQEAFEKGKGRLLKEIAFAGPTNQTRDFAIFISLTKSRDDPLLIEGIVVHELIHLLKFWSGEPFKDESQMSFDEYKNEERDIFYHTYYYMKRYQGWEFEELMGKIEGYGWRMKVPPRWLEFYREVWDLIPQR